MTLAQALRRGFPWAKVPSYWAAQVLGAFVGAALIYLNYHDAIASLEAAEKITRGSADSAADRSASSPPPRRPTSSPGSAAARPGHRHRASWSLFIFAVTDEFNAPVKANLAPLIVGFIVVAIGISFGANAGYAINPARDLGPRLLAWIAGWGGAPCRATTATSTASSGSRSSAR